MPLYTLIPRPSFEVEDFRRRRAIDCTILYQSSPNLVNILILKDLGIRAWPFTAETKGQFSAPAAFGGSLIDGRYRFDQPSVRNLVLGDGACLAADGQAGQPAGGVPAPPGGADAA